MNREVNINLSKKIFNELIRGKVINEYKYDFESGKLKRNNLFTELFENLNAYRKQYEMSGFELIDNPNFFYLRDENSSKNADKQSVKIKIYASLIIMVRYIMFDNGKLYTYLKDINYGVSFEDLKNLDKEVNYINILKAAQIKNGEDILNYLHNKGILLKTNKNKFILSDSGKSIVEDIIYKNK